MNIEGSKPNQKNDIFIYDKSKAELTGISEVIGFTDCNIVLSCRHGSISIEGESLKIDCFDSEVGKLSLTGDVSAVFYFGCAPKDKSKRGKRFKKNID